MTKVLLIEDDQRIVMAFGISLQSRGFEVVSAPDAATAIELVESARPDVVVLDIHLPGESGFTVAERLRGMAAMASVPVIFITASKQEGLWQRATELGATHFLEKPFGGTELAEAIEVACLSPSRPDEMTEIRFR